MVFQLGVAFAVFPRVGARPIFCSTLLTSAAAYDMPHRAPEHVGTSLTVMVQPLVPVPPPPLPGAELGLGLGCGAGAGAWLAEGCGAGWLDGAGAGLVPEVGWAP